MVVSMFVMLTTFVVRNEWRACAKINKVLMGVMALHMACPSLKGGPLLIAYASTKTRT